MNATKKTEREVIDTVKSTSSIDDISAALIYVQGIQMGKLLERSKGEPQPS